jgi:hypothetical protein
MRSDNETKRVKLRWIVILEHSRVTEFVVDVRTVLPGAWTLHQDFLNPNVLVHDWSLVSAIYSLGRQCPRVEMREHLLASGTPTA